MVNQFTIQGARMNRRPDVMVFINSLPIAVIELKNPADEQADIWDAFNQLQTYKDEISDLFVFNEALVVSDGITARIGSLTANKEWFMPWRTIKDADDKPLLTDELEKVVKGFFEPELLLDYIRYFIIFEQEGDVLIKKIAGYHQFHAVRVTVIASRQPEMNNPTIVVVTDRNDLDGQLFNTFCNARELLRQTPVQAGSRDELREMLAARQSGGIIFTTVQKFSLLI